MIESEYVVYIKRFTRALHNLSSDEYQRLAWFENDQNIISSFSDCVADVYEDYNFEEALYKRTVFGRKADNVLKDLNTMIEALGYDIDEATLIDMPEMEAIRQKAAEALRLVEASDYAGSMVEIIEE